MRNEAIAIVREIPLFSSMSGENLDELLRQAELNVFPARTQIIEEGGAAEFLHVLVEGTVELCGSLNDRETTMLVLRPISTFSLASILRGDPHLMKVRTLRLSKILMIPAEDVRKFIEIDPAFARATLAELANRYRSVMSAFKEQKLRTGVERLANYLIRASKQGPLEGQVLLTEGKRTLAALLGMTPEYLSRAFKLLRNYGVEVQESNIKLTNLPGLEKLAQPTIHTDDRDI